MSSTQAGTRPDPGDTSGEDRYRLDELDRFVSELLSGLGMPQPGAQAMAAALLDADLSRIQTHGLRLLPAYLARLQAGAINPTPAVTIERHEGGLSVVDGDDGFGQVVADRAVEHTLAVASDCGVAMTFVRRSNHLGALGFPARRGAEEGMFAFVGQNTRDIVTVPGGVRPGMGNNPFSLAMPSGYPDPMVLDISCGLIARNTIYRAAERGEQLPGGGAVDGDGNPTTDPNEAMRGALLAFGGHKGAGLAMFVGALAGVLSGAKFGPDVPSPTDYATDRNIGHFLLMVDVTKLGEAATAEERMRSYIDAVVGSGPDVRYPGQRSGAHRRDAREHGVLIAGYVLDKLDEIAAEAGLKIQRPSPVSPA